MSVICFHSLKGFTWVKATRQFSSLQCAAEKATFLVGVTCWGLLERVNQRRANLTLIIQHIHQWWESVMVFSGFFVPADVFFSADVLLSLKQVFSQRDSPFSSVSRWQTYKSYPQKCTDYIHFHLPKNVNNFKYSSCIFLMSQLSLLINS